VQTSIVLDDRPAASVPSSPEAPEAPEAPVATVLEFARPTPVPVQALAADTPAVPTAQGPWLAPLAEAPPPAAPAEAGAVTSPAPAGAGAVAPGDIDALVRRLHDPLVRRLKAELRLDRERVGRSLDLRH
jgi:hypothetical protein